MWILLNVGLLSILGQVVLLRELSVAFYGIELMYLLALAVWLLACAIGAVAGRWPQRLPARGVGMLLATFGVVLPASTVFIRAARLLLAAVPGAYLDFPQQLLVIVVALAPVSALLGVLFQWAARLYIADGGTLAMAYGVESGGGLIGGLCATLLFTCGIQNFAVAIASGFVAVLAALVRPVWCGNRIARVLAAGVVLGAVAFLSKAGALDRRMTTWSHPALVDTRDSPYGRVTAEQAGGQLSAFDNDALWFDSESPAAESFAHLVLLQHPNPRRVLLLGGGVEGIAAYALEHAPQVVDYVELNEQMYRMIVRYLPEGTGQSLTASSVHVFFTDPRRFVQQGSRYDVLLVAMPEPTSGAANRFYTREFFTACAGMLDAGGILGFRLQSSENFWTPLLTRRMVSIYRALRSAFPFVVVLPGSSNVFLASRSPLPSHETLVNDRLSARHIHATLVSGPYIRYLYTNDRRAEIAHTLETGRAPENTDIQPICYEYAAAIWLSKFFPKLAAMDLPSRDTASWGRTEWITWLFVLALFGVSRLRLRWRDTLLIAVVGFVGMVLETVLLLHFQMKNGIIFQDIGMLLTGFMGGLAVGAGAVNRWATHGGRGRTIPRGAGAALLGALIMSGLGAGAAVNVGAGGGLVTVTVLLGVTGTLVGALFAYVSLHCPTDQAGLVSPLYAADLLGGCVGSLVGSLVLIPLVGLGVSAQWAAVLAALSLVLV